MSNSKNSSNRLSVFVFNFLIFIISFLVVGNYIASPFFYANANVTLNKEQLVEILSTEDYPHANVDSAIPEEIAFDLELNIPASLLWTTNTAMLKQLVQEGNLNPDLSETTDALIDEQVNSIVDNLMPIIEEIALNIAKSVAVEQAKQAIIDALVSDSNTAEEIEEKLQAAGFSEEYFNEKMNTLTEDLSSGEKTTEEVTDKVVTVMNAILTDLSNSDDDTLKSLSEIDEVSLREKVSTGLNAFENENGVIDIDEAIADLLLKGLDTLSPSEEDAVDATPTAVALSATPTNENGSVEELKAEVKAKILELLPEGFSDTFAGILKISTIVLVLSIFTWIYVMIKILCKTFCQNNAVKLKLPLLLGHLPGLAFWLIPTIVFQVLQNSMNMGMLSLHFSSSGALAVLAAFALAIIAIPYCSIRHSLKPRKLR